MLGMDRVILRGHGQLGQAHEHTSIGDTDDVGVDNIHVIGCLTCDLAGVFENLPLQQLGRLPDGEACGERLTGSVCAEACRGHIGILAGQNMYFFIIGQAKDLRAHLRIGRICALTDLRFADLQIDRAVEIQLQTAGGGFQRNGENSSVVPEGRKADTAADGTGLVGVGLQLFFIADGLHALFHTLPVGVLIKFVFREAVNVAGLHQVLPAVGQRRHADSLCTLLCVGLIRERRLRHAIAAHGARRRAVGENSIGIALKVGAGIVLVKGAERLGDNRMAVGGVGALVGEALDLLGGDGAVLAQPGDDVRADGMADAVGDKRLFA